MYGHLLEREKRINFIEQGVDSFDQRARGHSRQADHHNMKSGWVYKTISVALPIALEFLVFHPVELSDTLDQGHQKGTAGQSYCYNF